MTEAEGLPPAFAGFDPVELDMIRRGDMLGPRLGQKTFDTIQRLTASLEDEREACARVAEDYGVAAQVYIRNVEDVLRSVAQQDAADDIAAAIRSRKEKA